MIGSRQHIRASDACAPSVAPREAARLKLVQVAAAPDGLACRESMRNLEKLPVEARQRRRWDLREQRLRVRNYRGTHARRELEQRKP